MLRSLKCEWNVMLHKKEFLVAFCAAMAFCVISFAYEVHVSLQFCGADLGKVVSADSIFAGNASSGMWYFFQYLFPFLIVLPHSISYIQDIDCGALPLLTTRGGRKRYVFSKLVVCFLGNMVIILIPFLLNLLLCHVALPVNENSARWIYGCGNYDGILLGTNHSFQTDYGALPFLRLFLYSPTLYNVLYILILSLASGITGVFVLCLSFFFCKQKAPLFLPVFLMVLGSSVLNVYCLSRAIGDASYKYVNYNLMDYFAAFGYRGQSPYYILSVAAVLLVFCAFAVRHVLRADEQLGGVKRAAR